MLKVDHCTLLMKPSDMKLIRLDWDSDFFGYEVAKVIDFTGSNEEMNAIQKSSFKLLYVFTQELILNVPTNYFLADEKVVLKMKVADQNLGSIKPEIKEVFEPTPELFQLALQSGVYSRFNVDAHFVNNEFERLYKQWMINSFKKARVFVYQEGDSMLAFTTLEIKNGIPDIGLIAVDENARGKGVGSALLNYLNVLLARDKFQELTVTTQGKNLNAMAFYKKNKFEILNRNFIYHVWK